MLSFTEELAATALDVDDHFEIGGRYYRITNIEPNASGAMVIAFHPHEEPSDNYGVLIAPPSMIFNVFNQT